MIMNSIDSQITNVLSELELLGINNTKINMYFERKHGRVVTLSAEEYLKQLNELLEKEKLKKYQSQIRKRILRSNRGYA